MKRICVIGAGPSGMSCLYQLNLLKQEGDVDLKIVCYEKQEEWGGLWNYTWKTGIDEYGEPVHSTMYRYLWSNGPKEASLEYTDYTFDDHFGKPIPSFPPREVLLDYLKGRWRKNDLRKYISFHHSVKRVRYENGEFVVTVKDLIHDVVLPEQKFDYVLNASGHFTYPNVPTFPGLNQFPGRVFHARDFRNASEFFEKRMLIVGSSYSAEDISLQCIKYGAKSVICSYRTNPMGFKWPETISERPLLKELKEKTAYFVDGSTAEVDVIILATGYLNHYPWLDEELRMNAPNTLYPPDLYKGTLWLKGGGGKMFYVGIQDQYYTFSMFDVQARWAVRVIADQITLPNTEIMKRDTENWIKRKETLKNCHEEIDFQTDFVLDLAKESGYTSANLDVSQLFHKWEHWKHEDILTYRDRECVSVVTGTKTPIHHTSWIKAMDDSLECYLSI